jgi:hypothetical protein
LFSKTLSLLPVEINLYMEYRSLINVTGLSGLFELINSKQDGAIVKSLIDGKSAFVSSRKHQFSHLEGIEVYTTGDNVNLIDVFRAMEASTEALPNDKDNDAVKAYFKKVFPTMDFERVYVSDMRKMVKWSASLKTNNVNLAPAEDKPVVEEVVAPAVEEKPAKAEKVAKAKKEEGAAEAPAEVKEPAKKKAAPKKTAEAKNEAGKEEAPAKKAAPKKKKAE